MRGPSNGRHPLAALATLECGGKRGKRSATPLWIASARSSDTSCVRQKICFERATAFSLPLLLKKEERAGERRRFLSIPPLSGSLPARSSRGEREAERRRRFACRTQLLREPQHLCVSFHVESSTRVLLCEAAASRRLAFRSSAAVSRSTPALTFPVTPAPSPKRQRTRGL